MTYFFPQFVCIFCLFHFSYCMKLKGNLNFWHFTPEKKRFSSIFSWQSTEFCDYSKQTENFKWPMKPHEYEIKLIFFLLLFSHTEKMYAMNWTEQIFLFSFNRCLFFQFYRWKKIFCSLTHSLIQFKLID